MHELYRNAKVAKAAAADDESHDAALDDIGELYLGLNLGLALGSDQGRTQIVGNRRNWYRTGWSSSRVRGVAVEQPGS